MIWPIEREPRLKGKPERSAEEKNEALSQLVGQSDSVSLDGFVGELDRRLAERQLAFERLVRRRGSTREYRMMTRSEAAGIRYARHLLWTFIRDLRMQKLCVDASGESGAAPADRQ